MSDKKTQSLGSENKNNNRPSSKRYSNRSNTRGNKKFYNNKFKKNNNNSSNLDYLKKEFNKIFDNYLILKTNLFNIYYTNDLQRKKSIKNKYFNALKSLNEFENKLKPWQKEQIISHGINYPEDKDYSINHATDLKNNEENEKESSINLEEDNIVDPHILITQVKRESFKEDNEESAADPEWISEHYSKDK
jgi:hypothetical protein